MYLSNVCSSNDNSSSIYFGGGGHWIRWRIRDHPLEDIPHFSGYLDIYGPVKHFRLPNPEPVDGVRLYVNSFNNTLLDLPCPSPSSTGRGLLLHSVLVDHGMHHHKYYDPRDRREDIRKICLYKFRQFHRLERWHGMDLGPFTVGSFLNRMGCGMLLW